MKSNSGDACFSQGTYTMSLNQNYFLGAFQLTTNQSTFRTETCVGVHVFVLKDCYKPKDEATLVVQHSWEAGLI